jgi:hypothetical protein
VVVSGEPVWPMIELKIESAEGARGIEPGER